MPINKVLASVLGSTGLMMLAVSFVRAVLGSCVDSQDPSTSLIYWRIAVATMLAAITLKVVF